MRQIAEDDLILLYYGEHDDPGLAARVAGSEDLSARFDALCAELALADAFAPPERGDDYGSEVWERISPRLEAKPAGLGSNKAKSLWKSWLSSFGRPRFSLAGALSLVLVATLAFMLGRNGGQPDNAVSPELVANPAANPAMVLAGIDSGRLLTRSVSGHLEQVNLVLTQFANAPETSADEAERATDMLVANRLYRRAAESRGELKLAAFLAELEPLLIEMAYEAHASSPATRERMQQEVQDGLLFRVRVMNKQLKKTQV
jgi:hypothetical protein